MTTDCTWGYVSSSFKILIFKHTILKVFSEQLEYSAGTFFSSRLRKLQILIKYCSSYTHFFPRRD